MQLRRALLAAGLALVSQLGSCAWLESRPSSVDVYVRADGGAGELVNDGYAVTLERAQLAVSSVTLLPCAESAAFSWSDAFGLRSAHAHPLTSSTALAGPVAVNLLEGNARLFGTLWPPAGDYCEVALVGRGDDAEPLLLGASLRIAGSWQRGAAGGAFDWETTAAFDVSLGLPDAGARLAGRDERWAVALTASLEGAFAGVDFQSDDEVSAVRRVLGNVRDGITLTRYEEP